MKWEGEVEVEALSKTKRSNHHLVFYNKSNCIFTL